MFTGLIRSVGTVKNISYEGANRIFTVTHELDRTLESGSSLNINGTCLTVLESSHEWAKVEAVGETLMKTNLRLLKVGAHLNLEPSLLLNDALDGHMLQGHIDTTSRVKGLVRKGNYYLLHLPIPNEFRELIINRGSIGVDGISLTIAEVLGDRIKLAIIPHTFENTNLKYRKVGEEVNIEFDVFGKYIQRIVKNNR